MLRGLFEIIQSLFRRPPLAFPNAGHPGPMASAGAAVAISSDGLSSDDGSHSNPFPSQATAGEHGVLNATHRPLRAASSLCSYACLPVVTLYAAGVPDAPVRRAILPSNCRAGWLSVGRQPSATRALNQPAASLPPRCRGLVSDHSPALCGRRQSSRGSCLTASSFSTVEGVHAHLPGVRPRSQRWIGGGLASFIVRSPSLPRCSSPRGKPARLLTSGTCAATARRR